jgi:hypothetical protein
MNVPEWLKKKIDKILDERRENIRYARNTARLKQIVRNKKTVCVIAPIPDEYDCGSDYERRVEYIDQEILKDYYLIYLNGEDRGLEHLNTTFADERHANIVFNSFDMSQTDEVLKLIEESGTCLIHSVIRFIREKLSSDMYRIFDTENVTTIWDSHGAVPEQYHELSNIHTEMVTNDIEKIFYEKADVLICDSDELTEHFKEKYGERRMKYVVCPSEDASKKLKETIDRL